MQIINKETAETLEGFISSCLGANNGISYNTEVLNGSKVIGEIILAYYEYNGSYLNVHVYANKGDKDLSHVRKIDVTSFVSYLDYAQLVHTQLAKAHETLAFLLEVEVTESAK